MLICLSTHVSSIDRRKLVRAPRSLAAYHFYYPYYCQIGLGYSAQTAGLLLVPMALGILMVKSVSYGFLRFFDYKKLLLMNTLCRLCIMGVSNRHCPNITLSYRHLNLYFRFPSVFTIQRHRFLSLLSEIATDDLSSATSIVSTVQQLAQSFRVAVSALLLRYYSADDEHISLTPTVFHHTFFAMGLLTFFAIFIFLRLKPQDGHRCYATPPKTKS